MQFFVHHSKHRVQQFQFMRHVNRMLFSRRNSSSQLDVVHEDSGEEKSNYFIDARHRVPLVNSKIHFTDKKIEERIIYNSFADSFTDRASFLDRVKKYTRRNSQQQIHEKNQLLNEEVDSIAASLIINEPKTLEDTKPVEQSLISEENDVIFPYSASTPINKKFEKFKTLKQNEINSLQLSNELNYGNPDPAVPVSSVPCGGCGAMLHCQSPSIPGYMPSELFLSCEKHDLRGQICQRCRFLREHNVALNVNVSPDDYPKVISVIRDQTAMVVLVVDLLDFPCSIWPDLLSIVGTKRPVFVVGNKIDLIPKDSKGYLDHVKNCLVAELEKSGIARANIKHVSLISATSGYGIEQLITKIQHIWGTKGDIYLLGCTNVGKSSLFNALINSDFCKTQAIDLLERATVSPWPGTTLNLLKFPILRPSAIRLRERTLRLIAERRTHDAEEKLRKEKLKDTRDRSHATLIGHIGRTFTAKTPEEIESFDPFDMKAPNIPGEVSKNFNPKHKDFLASKWCCDTPGTISHSQILTLLTLEELMLLLPKKQIKPRTLLVRPGTSFFLAGLGRIDYREGPHSLMLTTFASGRLPLTLINYQDADQMYTELLGSPLLAIPFGNEQRLKHWPGLSGKDITIKGVGWKESSADIILSSAGWVAVTGEKDTSYDLKVHTPYGRGIYVRDPPLLPHAVMLRGSRLERSPAFRNNKIFI